MEVSGEDGSNLVLKTDSVTAFGRGSGVISKDRTISRRHVLFKTKTSKNSNESGTEARVSFEVVGKNPIWVKVKSCSDEEIRIFRRLEKGEVAAGDWFCIGGKEPVWFNLKKVDEFEEGKSENLEDVIDISEIDPVKEFGFLVMGHEFDCYGNRVIRDPKKWDWFLEETRKNSDSDDDYGRKKRRGARGKRKKGADSDNEDWTDENEDAMETVVETKKVQRSKYSTRSKDRNKAHKDMGGAKAHVQKKTANSNKVYEEDEDDETLGGFIIDDEVDNEEKMDDDDDDEELLDDEDEEEED